MENVITLMFLLKDLVVYLIILLKLSKTVCLTEIFEDFQRIFSKNSTFNRNVLKFLQTGRLIEEYA
jgi:hypothetical protein